MSIAFRIFHSLLWSTQSNHNVINSKSLKDTGHVINHNGKECEKEWVYMYITQSLYCTSGDAGNSVSISGLGRYPGGGNGNPLQYSCRENPMDREAWWATATDYTTKLRYSQTQSKVTVLWRWDAEFSSQGRNSIVPFAAWGAVYLFSSSQAKQMLNAIFTLPLFHKSKNSLWDFFWLAKMGSNIGFFHKSNVE